MGRFLAGFLAGVLAIAAALWIGDRWPLPWPVRPGAGEKPAPGATASPSEAPPSAGPVVPGSDREPPTPSPAPSEPVAPPSSGPEQGPGPAGTLVFEHRVPEIVAFRGHDFVRLVEAANRKRTFDDPAELARADDAWRRTLDHAARLDADPATRAFDGLRATIARDSYFGPYEAEFLRAGPYLIAWTDGTRTDPRPGSPPTWEDLRARERARADVRTRARRTLAEKGAIFTQLYAEYLRRFGAVAGLRDLMSEWGGRSDLPASQRSYRDGYPLLVWMFSDDEVARRHQEEVEKEPHAYRSYFAPSPGWVVLAGYGPTEREVELQDHLRLAAYQLADAFNRQHREWGRSWVTKTYLDTGIAGHLAGAAMGRDRRLEFTGVNRSEIVAARRLAGDPLDAARVYVPLRSLVGLSGTVSIQAYAAKTLRLRPSDAITAFHAEAYALVRFLAESSDDRRRQAYLGLAEDLLAWPVPSEGYAYTRFAERLGLRSGDDWKALDREFAAWYANLLATDSPSMGPPPLDDWPSYVEPR